MARFDAAQRELLVQLTLCGPAQAGKSTVLDRLRERLGERVVGRRRLHAAPILVGPAPALRLLVDVVEVEPVEADAAVAGLAFAESDGLLFVADARHERLRDDVVAYAWLLEQMRAAERDDLLGVLLLNRRDAPTRLTATDLEAAIGAGRFPSFEVDATHGDEVARGVGELVRRVLARVHARDGLESSGVALSDLVVAFDAVASRAPEAAAPSPVASGATAEPASPSAAPESAVAESSVLRVRAPLVRFGQRIVRDQGRLARERRRLHDRLAWIEEETRRPLAFLASLFRHLERESPRLSSALEEAVAGGREVLAHLESIVAAHPDPTRRDRGEGRLARRQPCDLEAVARQAFAALERDRSLARLELRAASLPWWVGDVDALRALLWLLFVAVARSRAETSRSRPGVVRVRARVTSGAVRLRISRLGALRRGRGLDELLLARRLARRLGLAFTLVARRAGRRDVELQFVPSSCAAPTVSLAEVAG
jgi:hypothetical protein